MDTPRCILGALLLATAVAVAGCVHTDVASVPCPEIRSARFTVDRNFDAAFLRAVETVSLLGGRVISQDRKAGTLLAVVHTSVDLSVTVYHVGNTQSEVYVWGSAPPSVGGFTEVEHYRIIFLEQS